MSKNLNLLCVVLLGVAASSCGGGNPNMVNPFPYAANSGEVPKGPQLAIQAVDGKWWRQYNSATTAMFGCTIGTPTTLLTGVATSTYPSTTTYGSTYPTNTLAIQQQYNTNGISYRQNIEGFGFYIANMVGAMVLKYSGQIVSIPLAIKYTTTAQVASPYTSSIAPVQLTLTQGIGPVSCFNTNGDGTTTGSCASGYTPPTLFAPGTTGITAAYQKISQNSLMLSLSYDPLCNTSTSTSNGSTDTYDLDLID